MEIEHKRLADKIHLLTFGNQQDITSTFLRFQEHYESPYFQGKNFPLDEFKIWYIQNSPNGIKTGNFTYYSDWNGFNIPSYVLKPFYEGKFDPLSDQEQQFLEIFKNIDGVFYIIGLHGEYKNQKAVLRHEIAHALFYTNENYQSEVLQLLLKFNIESMKKEIFSLGYHENVLDDEVHAFCVDTGRDLKTPIPEKLSEELNNVYNKYFE